MSNYKKIICGNIILRNSYITNGNKASCTFYYSIETDKITMKIAKANNYGQDILLCNIAILHYVVKQLKYFNYKLLQRFFWFCFFTVGENSSDLHTCINGLVEPVA